MLRSLWISKTGMEARQLQLDNISNTGLQIGLGVQPVATPRDFTQGSLQQTGNNLDVAISGSGFLQVTMPDGTTACTRDGSLKVRGEKQVGVNQNVDTLQ